MASLFKAPSKLGSLSRFTKQPGISTRGLKTSARPLAAQNFTMPAMSPTMTEGNITNWKVKEGDAYSTGDVLLEIETDKAQMDVEAQDDGKVAKITQQAGAKGIGVGARIAILAETDDDLSTISLPEEDPLPNATPAKETSNSENNSSIPSESQPTAPKSSPSDTSTSKQPTQSSTSSSKPQKQIYPLYPSVSALLHQHNLSPSTADTIPASGPKGRLLKGDVLAYLGQIDKSYSSQQSARITKLGHLDLSNIKPLPPPEPATRPTAAQAAPPPTPVDEPLDTEVAVPISLSAVLAVQKRVQETLGVTLPLSTFLARATELANENLPRATAPTSDELFDDVIGVRNVYRKVSRGDFIPSVSALPSQSGSRRRVVPGRRKEDDVYDILTGKPTPSSTRKAAAASVGGGATTGDSTNLFSVTAARGEEKRARVFLERVKTILQVEPGKLVL